jgi:hypothetical protein
MIVKIDDPSWSTLHEGERMAIELPGELVWVMNLLGVNWPQANEDGVREFAGHVREFASNIDGTHQAATTAIRRMGESYQATSYEQLVAKWGQMSSDHMSELVEICGMTAIALEVAADMIVGAKLAVITELGIMAAEFVADQAAAVMTLGAAEAAEILLIEATKKIVNGILQQVEQELVGHLMEKAITPLEGVVQRAMSGLVFEGVEAALKVPASGGNAGQGFKVHSEELMGHASVLRGHAQEVAGHATRFTTATAGVSFS